ncbi:hypothetical protein ACWGE0_37675 [Lentzea sp. NPDC054927]
MNALHGLARNPSLPTELLERLIAVGDHHLDLVLASRSDLSPEQAGVLAARSERTLIETDCELEPPTSEFDAALQQAADETVAPSVLAELMRHPNSSIRHVVARRRNLPQWAWERLAKDADDGVRHIVAGNPAAPEAVLRELAAKSDRETRRVVVRNRSIPLDLLVSFVALTTLSPVPRVAVASEAELRALASSAATPVRLLAAWRHDLPGDVLDLLLGDPEPDVAAVVAANPAVTASRLETLVDRHGPKVFAGVAQNPNCTPELLDLLARDARTTGRAYRVIAKHPNASVETVLLCRGDREARRLAAARPDLPVAALVELVADPYAGEAAAANPSLPVHVMENLFSSTT